MTTIQPDAVLAAGAVESFATVWSSAATAEEVAPSLACSETDALAVVFRTAGALDIAEMWINKHIATASECEGHDTGLVTTQLAEPPLFDQNGNYTPAPGTEYPFSISDITDGPAPSPRAGAEPMTPATTTTTTAPATASVISAAEVLRLADPFTPFGFDPDRYAEIVFYRCRACAERGPVGRALPGGDFRDLPATEQAAHT